MATTPVSIPELPFAHRRRTAIIDRAIQALWTLRCASENYAYALRNCAAALTEVNAEMGVEFTEEEMAQPDTEERAASATATAPGKGGGKRPLPGVFGEPPGLRRRTSHVAWLAQVAEQSSIAAVPDAADDRTICVETPVVTD